MTTTRSTSGHRSKTVHTYASNELDFDAVVLHLLAVPDANVDLVSRQTAKKEEFSQFDKSTVLLSCLSFLLSLLLVLLPLSHSSTLPESSLGMPTCIPFCTNAECYLSSNSLTVKVERELFASVFVDFGFNLLAFLLSVEANVNVDGDRKAKETL